MLKYTIERFIEKARLIHGDKYDYSKFIYINSQIEGIIICNKCKTEFLQTPHKHLYGHGCLNCFNKDRSRKCRLGKINDQNRFSLNAPQKLLNEFNTERNLKELGLTIGGLAINSNTKVFWVCSVNKEHKWLASINNRLSKQSNCPYCNIWNNQEELRNILKCIFKVTFDKKRFYFINIFHKDKRKRICMEFDGYNDKLKIAFEYNGIQHYKYPNYFHKNKLQFQKLRSKDLFKQKFCIENNIKLIIVPYYAKDLYSYVKEIW
jgi:hypothetical protein